MATSNTNVDFFVLQHVLKKSSRIVVFNVAALFGRLTYHRVHQADT